MVLRGAVFDVDGPRRNAKAVRLERVVQRVALTGPRGSGVAHAAGELSALGGGVSADTTLAGSGVFLRSVRRVAQGRQGQPRAVTLDGRTLQSTCDMCSTRWLQRLQAQTGKQGAYGRRA